jgi:hypothetical protein
MNLPRKRRHTASSAPPTADVASRGATQPPKGVHHNPRFTLLQSFLQIALLPPEGGAGPPCCACCTAQPVPSPGAQRRLRFAPAALCSRGAAGTWPHARLLVLAGRPPTVLLGPARARRKLPSPAAAHQPFHPAVPSTFRGPSHMCFRSFPSPKSLLRPSRSSQTRSPPQKSPRWVSPGGMRAPRSTERIDKAAKTGWIGRGTAAR